MRLGPGVFVCDQRDLGGELWDIVRRGRSNWQVTARRPAPRPTLLDRLLRRQPEAIMPSYVLSETELRPWINGRADALEARFVIDDDPDETEIDEVES